MVNSINVISLENPQNCAYKCRLTESNFDRDKSLNKFDQ